MPIPSLLEELILCLYLFAIACSLLSFMSATRLPYLRIDTSTEGLATPPVRVLVPPSQSSEIPNYSLQEAWTALTIRVPAESRDQGLLSCVIPAGSSA